MTEHRSIPGVLVRALESADVDDAVELLATSSAYDNRFQLRKLLIADHPDHAGRTLVADRGGAIVGAAALTAVPSLPGTAAVRVVVTEAERGQGIGTVLAGEVASALGGRSDFRTLTCALRDDLPRGRRFAERYGLTVTNHSVGWKTDVPEREEDLRSRLGKVADGPVVRLRPLDMETETELLTAVASRCLIGFPVPFGTGASVDLGSVLQAIPRGAVFLLAELEQADGGEAIPCGLTVLAPEAGGSVWHTIFTGVDPDHRRRGVGKAVKAAQLAEARSVGVQVVTALNDETNEPVMRLNQAMGMVRTLGYWSMARSVPDGADATV
ncbi:GNAT family N-acetyltransferase [Streptomyces sp. Isolate_45]|uniref:GNAT family N-acetyltransferase n=1 Tax=Streptomyces sp. Isolate_45 TaxID=2950111 RepID=UPI002482057D|nr:GNAT family N-acetyltransferase [Streptomyces sp. Isolate_45]MDA5285009.1 GNAT family N-acetyltransferase [Streptomyces sp. Isolate_45]